MGRYSRFHCGGNSEGLIDSAEVVMHSVKGYRHRNNSVPFPHPQPRPLPRSKLTGRRMTIAVGFQCDEGIVLCADTEQTAEPFKQRTRKVVLTSDPEGKHLVAFAGAGWTDYILTAIEKATDGLGECIG